MVFPEASLPSEPSSGSDHVFDHDFGHHWPEKQWSSNPICQSSSCQLLLHPHQVVPGTLPFSFLLATGSAHIRHKLSRKVLMARLPPKYKSLSPFMFCLHMPPRTSDPDLMDAPRPPAWLCWGSPFPHWPVSMMVDSVRDRFSWWGGPCRPPGSATLNFRRSNLSCVWPKLHIQAISHCEASGDVVDHLVVCLYVSRLFGGCCVGKCELAEHCMQELFVKLVFVRIHVGFEWNVVIMWEFVDT